MGQDEEELLRAVALQNASSILAARRRAEKELIAAQEALRETNERITSILESITDAFIVVDKEWRFTYLNKRALEIFRPLEKTRENFLGSELWKEFPGLIDTHAEQQLKHALQQQVSVEFENFYSGLKAWFDVRAYPAKEGLSIYFQDISARKQVEDQLRQQREWFEVTLSSIGDAVITTDTHGKVSFLNPIAESLTGWKLNAAIGEPLEKVFRIVNETTGLVVENPVSKVLQEGVIVGLANHTALIAKDGSRTAIEDSAAPIKDSNGNISGAVMVFHDVSERRRVEEVLRESAERDRATFNQAAVGIAVADLNGRFVEMNLKFRQMLGYATEELLRLTFLDITHPEDKEQTRVNVRRLTAGEVTDYAHEKRFLCKDGAIVWALTTVTAVTDVAGKPQRFVGVLDDITERKRMEVALVENARRTQLAFSAGDLGDWTWDAATDLMALSPRTAEIYGAPLGKSLTRTEMREVLHEDDREAARVALERSVNERIDYDMEYRVYRPDGQLRWVAAKGRGIYAKDGAITSMTGIVQDITARKKADEALKDETRVLELLNKTGATIASSLDLQTLVQAITDAATELSGAEFGSFFYNIINETGEAFMLFALSGAPREAFEKFGHPRATALFGPTFRGEGPIRCDDVLQDSRYGKWSPHFGMPPGHLPVRSYLALPVISRSGEVIGGLFFGHSDVCIFTERTERVIAGIAAQAAVAIDNARLYDDVKRAATERAQLLQSERAARAEAERVSRLKDDFLTTLSHELRTPLHAIVGWSHVLLRGKLSGDELNRGLEAIVRNAKAQTQLIEDLLDMSRIVSGKVRIDVQPTNLTAIVEAAVDSIRPSADAKEIRLRTILDPLASPVSGDPNRLQQIIWNLLSNAVKFTPKGGKVEVLLQRVNSHLEIAVSDSGMGIAPDFLPHVFDRFRQGDATITRSHGGLGLGLSIVKQLVELHGGSVRAASDGLGHGATFIVSLPLSAVRPDANKEHPASSNVLAFDAEEISLTGIKVLVIDDDIDARELVKRILVQCNAEVILAASANEGLNSLTAQLPHVIVSDIGMPEKDGYRFIREVRKLPASQGGATPAIALTAFARSEDRTRAMIAGFQVHISKPIEPQELTATVRSLAGRLHAS